MEGTGVTPFAAAHWPINVWLAEAWIPRVSSQKKAPHWLVWKMKKGSVLPVICNKVDNR